jgi:hypothetical protein
MGKKKPQRNERANKSFQARYGMTRSEWATYKKTNPKEAHELRMKVHL